MSSYNGEKYIREQIDSVLSQKDCKFRLIVRDDGSTDGTCDILNEYHEQGLLDWYRGPNIGPARSYMELISSAPKADYYALCDQDDYWLDDKLITAISFLVSSHKPALYFSQSQLTDSSLNPIKTAKIKPLCTMGEAMIAFYATGCTFVFNDKLRESLLEYNPRYLSMHDCWIYRVCLAVSGNIIFDPQSHIYYRQHSNNVIGLGHTAWQNWKRRLLTIFNGKHERSKMALELLKGYGHSMRSEDKILVYLSAKTAKSFTSRLKLILNKNLKSQSWKCNITSRLAILFGTY